MEPKELWINLFLDNKRHYMNAEQCFERAEDAYEGVLDGQRESTYRYTLHVWTVEGTKHSEIIDLEQDAHEWQRDSDIEARQNEDSFIYAGSAGRRL